MMDERNEQGDGISQDAPGRGQVRVFDWDLARRRLAAAGMRLAMLDAGGTAAAPALQEVWARRAAELAREPSPEEMGERTDLVIVELGCEMYGLEARYVSDIRLIETIARVPRVPVWVLGLVNVRGRILSVIDLPLFWGQPATGRPGDAGKEYMVVVEAPAMELALRVDQVLAVESVPIGRLSSPSDLIRNLPPEYVRGVWQRPTRDLEPGIGEAGPVTVLDLPAMLADPRLIVQSGII